MPDAYTKISESVTRAKLIDPLLTAAGWNLKDRTQVDFEIPVDGYDKEPWNGITAGLLKQVRVIVPPLPFQQKFAAIVRRFERLRAQQREAERQAEHLFQTLLHRAFSEAGV